MDRNRAVGEGGGGEDGREKMEGEDRIKKTRGGDEKKERGSKASERIKWREEQEGRQEKK